MACHDTEANGRTKYTIKTIQGLLDTVDFDKHHLFISDNGSCAETIEHFVSFQSTLELNGYDPSHFTILLNGENLGTAGAINLGLRERKGGQHAAKIDNDCFIKTKGWADEMEELFALDPTLGIIGLKRVDVWQHPNHEKPEYRTVMECIGKYDVEICPDIIGTCTGFNSALVDKINYMNQPTVYGGDDVLYSCRSLVAGFRNCFLPHVDIEHLDKGGDAYCEWKKREAGMYLGEISGMCELYRSGSLDVNYEGGFSE